MNSISVKNLSKKFSNFTAVDNISFGVSTNKVTGFLGPNGAGKTTTIRMIVGLSKPSLGDIEIEGERVIFGKSETNRLIGYLPEQPSFYNWMTGEEYLSFLAGIFKLPNKSQKISEMLSLVNLTDSGKKRINTYSNGMKQRLGIAQALLNDPRVLVMDEPVSALDPIGRREVLEIIENVKSRATIFYSTHILSDVDRICDDVVIINKGKLVATSPLSLLKEKYATLILELEFDKSPGIILDDLKRENWVRKTESSGNNLKIWLSDAEVMKTNIPLKFFAGKEISVMKYGLNLPQVEDLFVTLLEEK